MTDGEKRYQILRGRLYERLPVLALALGLLDWREAEKTGTDGQFFYAPVSFLAKAQTDRETAERTLLHSVLHAMLGHIWERGNRELLMAIFARTLTKAPTAKALVYTLAEYVKPSLDYRCFSEPRSGQYGLLVRLDCEPVAMTAPFSANRADVEKLAAQLTVQHSRGSARADRRMDKTRRRDVGGVPYGFLKIIRLCVGAD